MSEQDLELAHKAVKGDIEAFEQLVEIYQKKVYNIALKMIGNNEDAYELAQEAFIRMFKGISSFRGDCKFSTWVHKITVNVCLDEIKKRKRIITYEVSSQNDEALQNIRDESPTLEEQTLEKERKSEINKALHTLSNEHRAMIILRDIQGYSYSEIAQIMSIPEGTTKSRINRARITLANTLKKSELFSEKKVK